MTILTVDDIKAHANIVTTDDDTLLGDYIAAAEEWVGDFIGQTLADMDPAPEKAKQAVRQIVAYWYDQREGAIVGLTGGVSSTEIPFGVADLLRPLRTWGAHAMSAQSERLARRLNAIPKAVKDAVQPALAKSGEELAGRIKALAPVDTGALRDSVAVTLPGHSTPPYSQPGGSQVAGENEVLVTVGNTHVRYAHLVEYGTVKAHAQPYFWPAFRLSRKRIENRIKRAISKAVKDSWGAT